LEAAGINGEAAENFSLLQLLLLSCPTAFSSLKKFEVAHDGHTNAHQFSAILSLFLGLLSPRIEDISIAGDDVRYPRSLAFAWDAIANTCTSLRSLKIICPSGQSAIPTISRDQLRLCKSLTVLELRPVKLSQEVIEVMVKMPNLAFLDFETDGYLEGLVPESIVVPDIIGFDHLRELKIYDKPFNIFSLLGLFHRGNCLERLIIRVGDGTEEEQTEGFNIFPGTFLGKCLTYLKVRSTFLDRIGLNTMEICARLSHLCTLHLDGLGYLPLLSDSQLVQGLQTCHHLTDLDLCAHAENFVPEADLERPTLGCLQPLLMACQSLRTIRGTFDLIQASIPPTRNPPHPNIQSIDLTTSYFVTFPPPDSWWVKTAGYLASFFNGTCAIALSLQVCFVDETSEPDKALILARRKLDKKCFDDAVAAINHFKSHSTTLEGTT
jgi:hypothetical protein